MQPIRRLRLHLEHESIKIWMTFWHCCSHFPSGGFIPTTTLLTINEFLPNNIPRGKGTHRKSRGITWLYEPVSKGSAGKPSAFLRMKRFIRPSLAPLSMCSFGAEILMLQLYCDITPFPRCRYDRPVFFAISVHFITLLQYTTFSPPFKALIQWLVLRARYGWVITACLVVM